MKNISTIIWVIVSTILIGSIILREPNVESIGAIIQESQYKETDSEKKVDKIIIFLFLIFICLTVFLFIQYQ